MKTDRELLELAAKAVGYKINHAGQYARDSLTNPATAALWLRDGSTAWNPLKNDGDALRLAVNLGICFGPNFDGDTAVCFGADGRNITEPHGEDKTAATRRAIVRAAAAIGEAMP